MAKQQPTNQEILEAILDFSGRTDERFTGIENRLTRVESKVSNIEIRLTSVETKLAGVETRLTGVETRLTGVETRLTGVEKTLATQVVTKDYLDERLEAFKRELVEPVKIEDKKVVTLTNKLNSRKILPIADIAEVLAIKPFPTSR